LLDDGCRALDEGLDALRPAPKVGV
jgi:hypothetical protein